MVALLVKTIGRKMFKGKLAKGRAPGSSCKHNQRNSDQGVHRSKPQLCLLRCRSHPHVRARRVFDNRELAIAGFARRNAARLKLRYPFVPDRPPRP
jgi:hypothetical protein